MEPSQYNFCHPYEPYPIQLDFMTNLYRCIEDGKVGIFESPTGTGKSLSLICGALTWLRDYERRSLDSIPENQSESDWLLQAEVAAQRQSLMLEREELELKLARLRKEESLRRQKKVENGGAKKPRTVQAGLQDHLSPDDDFLVEEYDSEGDTSNMPLSSTGGFSTATQALLDKLQKSTKTEVETAQQDRLKIIFCSRTHSQLTQFVNELRRVKPPSSIPSDLMVSSGLSDLEETVKHLALGSRKNLCINPEVSRLSSTAAINERCLELQKPGTAKDKKCPYLPSKEDKERVELFRDKVIAQIKDIEDIGELGRSMELCPYYAGRAAIGQAEVLTLPYPLLLQKSAREALGVSLKGNVIIIDEAHNLMDAIADTFSVSLRLNQLEEAVQQMTGYAVRFKNRLKGKNRVYVTQVIRLLNSLTECMRGSIGGSVNAEITVTAAQLMSGKGVDQIKPHKLLQYLHESKLCHKVEGYTEAQKVESESTAGKGAMMQFQNFLIVLMNPDEEGRFFISRQDKDIIVRYTLLDPREHFRHIVEESRAVILAGGTMSPMSDYSDYLFSYINRNRLETYSFGHVITPTNLFAQAVVTGPSGVEFDFTYGKRGSESMIAELGNVIGRTCKAVPDGVVVFFPSYDYLSQAVSVWGKLPTSCPLIQCFSEAKVVFQESRGVAADELLRDYAMAVDTGKGALLLSVIGGKLSEGINFSDRLGRAVIAVGLPFPNANGGEWKAKMQHIEEIRYQQRRLEGMKEGECKAAAKSASREFYENACMRAINQSIGRVIRHKNDYAAILVVDRRFSTDRIRQKLPGWIQDSMGKGAQNWQDVEDGMANFFQGKP
ncbi:ATP-dependent DNA helicase chl1 [Elasticomyces elasticus]|uniref:ATP-dependent DNA helicase CHL1 n=1 Tax=Exophiala sideris TaxID=1016849 RepID=A0ABR0IUF9_9EURO|nr:ATP-dependent DNA helicase chl1 [Elasticomyces elasticus]KAK5020962.1 ATP-dependent DNA helicase chl1 [Exophiala sideris]KAK5028105.1 ATP-dependent DNA helicase chl1 [Exophiala sideris]KAK5048454.1 ATP-dependent DNA helicase chl1 [Exophiala sideris]KAK5176062.1 ATP-dependent DNA helicase chl1 [Eurotiomycetes sp. CCFEE 6388]